MADDGLTIGQRSLIAALKRLGRPVTRETYIAMNWNGAPPDPWGAEDEAELPEFLQMNWEAPGAKFDSGGALTHADYMKAAYGDAGPADEPRDDKGRWTAGTSPEDKAKARKAASAEVVRKAATATADPAVVAHLHGLYARMHEIENAKYSSQEAVEAARPEHQSIIAELDKVKETPEGEKAAQIASTQFAVETTPKLLQVPPMLFHGTSSVAAAKILKEGIKPHGGPGGDAWALKHGMGVGIAVDVGGRDQSVYLTTRPELAAGFAKLAKEAYPKSSATLLKVTVPPDQADKMHIDELAKGDPQIAFRFEGTIPPAWITKAPMPKRAINVAGAMLSDAEPANVFYVLVLGDEPDNGEAHV